MSSLTSTRWRWRLLMAVSSACLAFGVGEVILRTNAPDPFTTGDGEWPAIVRDGECVSYTPGATLQMVNPEFRAVAHIDALGGRAGGVPVGSRPALVFLGDSQTFGIGVDDADTFASLLSARLREPIANFGVPGSFLGAQMQQLRALHQGLGHPAMYVFWFFAGNDLSDTIADADHTDAAVRRRVHAPRWFRALDSALQLRGLRWFEWTRLVRSAALRWLDEQPFDDLDRVLDFTGPNRDALRGRVESVLKRQVDELAALSQQFHFTAVVGIVPDRLQLYANLLAEHAARYRLPVDQFDLTYPNRLLASLLSARGIRLIDPTVCMRRQGAGLYYGETHLTPAGHRALAACATPGLAAAVQDTPRM